MLCLLHSLVETLPACGVMGEEAKMGFLDRLRHPGGLKVATLRLETHYRHKQGALGSSLEEYERVGPPLVESQFVQHESGISREQLLTVVIPEVIEHSLFQLSGRLYDRALTKIHARIASPTRYAPERFEGNDVRVRTKVELFFGREPYVLVWPKFPLDRWFGAPILVSDTAIAFFDEQFPGLTSKQQAQVIDRLNYGLEQWRLSRPTRRTPTWDWHEWIDYPSWIEKVTGGFTIFGAKQFWGYRKYHSDRLGLSIEYMDILEPHEVDSPAQGVIDVEFKLPGKEWLWFVINRSPVPRVDETLTPTRLLRMKCEEMRQSPGVLMFEPLVERDIEVSGLPAALGESRVRFAPGTEGAFIAQVWLLPESNHSLRLAWFSSWSVRRSMREVVSRMLSSLELGPPERVTKA